MVVGDDAVVVVASCPNVADRREVVASGFDGNSRCQSVRKEVGKLRVKSNKEVRSNKTYVRVRLPVVSKIGLYSA